MERNINRDRRGTATALAAEGIFLLSSVFCFFALASVFVFLISGGLPAVREIGLKEFLLGTEWKPSAGKYGIGTMLAGSAAVVVPAACIGALLGISPAIFLTFFCPKRVRAAIRFVIDLAAGIPSVVYGLFGLNILVPAVRLLFGGDGSSILTAALLLGMMITPTVAVVSHSALQAADPTLLSGGLALGASPEQCVFRIILPASGQGILAAVILGTGRALGETMAVMMVAGNQPRMPQGIAEGVRTLTSGIALEIGYASGLHRSALIAAAAVLLIAAAIIDLPAFFLRKGSLQK